METGKINVQTENIFPIIKKFLYSDQEIFLRELVSNAVDATQKLQKLASIGKYNGELGDLKIEISTDPEAKTITIKDYGLGMTDEEVKKYINQVAFSGAEDFLKKYKDLDKGKQIIGHFGLGFYSSFMVADKVEIFSKSYQRKKAIHWSCDGSPNFELQEGDKNERGTEIVLHISEDAKDYLQESKIQELLNKYCKFLPVEIYFGTEKVFDDKGEVSEENPKQVNNTSPLWTKRPGKIKDEKYLDFYRELYPFAEPPLFWIHLNVDYPFKLTGILYFPRVKQGFEVQKNKIQLYCNQVFVTDEVGQIVPEFLTLLHGVIDSPDIPLNVSRSYLQSDANVKKISSHISKKVAEKLVALFKKDRKSFEEKWEDVNIFLKYGMISDEKFRAKVKDIVLLENAKGKMFTFEELEKKMGKKQKDKDGNRIALYFQDREQQDHFVQAALDKKYEVLKLNTVIDNHFMQDWETKEEKWKFKRVDADNLSNLIDAQEELESVLSEEQEKSVKELFETSLNDKTFSVEIKALSPEEPAVSIVQPEFMRRMQEMQQMMGSQSFPGAFQFVVNSNHPSITKLLRSKGDNKAKISEQLTDIALLGQNMLKGERLTKFLSRSMEMI